MYQSLNTTYSEGTVVSLEAVKRLADNAFIPFAPDNSDYQAYLEWVAAGNTPEPAEDA